ncbi:hypothetical protein [Streptomyces sp. NBC_00005]|uniref:hypothetical protein n=1 Tax=Streptomyces sp. NBC_00005 TaxID=2903609 RepID=UPI003867F178
MTEPNTFTASMPATDRAEYGRKARARMSRSAHALFEAGEVRPDPIDVIERQSTTRVPELVPIRYGRALTGFAQSYAEQNERDFEALTAASRSGRITAERL